MLNSTEVKKVQRTVREGRERLPFIFEALSDPTLLKIFHLLMKHQDLCVTDLARVCKVSVPGISYQLKIMEVVGLVKKERMGKMICYELRKEDPLVKKIMRIIT